MFDDADDTIGAISELAQRIRPDLELGILYLAVEGLERWEARAFERFDDGEVSFTAVVIGRMIDAACEKNLPYVITAEQVEYSQDVLDGRASPRRAPRIDIAVRRNDFSQGTYFTIECKRLAPGYLVRKYVDEGMLRFKSGRYAGNMLSAGMIGFVIGGEPRTLWQKVNNRVRSRRQFTDADTLTPASFIRSLETVYQSRHARSGPSPDVRLTHLIFDVRSRSPYRTQKD